MSVQPDVCLVVTLDDQDRVLVIRRSAKNSRAGNWECPLGHRDPGENPTTAAHREVDEETGLKVTLYPQTFDKRSPDGKRIRVFLGRVKGATTVTTNPTEHDAHRWVPWNQLDSIDKCHDSFRGDVAKIIKLNGTTAKEAAMFNTPSQRGFMPQPLMNNQYAASFPANSALPSNPNPLSRTQPVNTTSADANGIQQAMAKRAAEKLARNLGLGNVPTGTGPQQMFSALSMLNQAKALVDPTETLKKHRLARGDFEGMVDELAADEGDSYDFDSYRKNPKSEALRSGLSGALLGGLGGAGAGALSSGGLGAILGGLGGAAAGGLGGAGYGHMSAGSHNKKLLGTAKVLREYGLLQPEYLRAALPLLKESSDCNMRPSAAGEGDKKYKIDPAADAKGEEAFKSLDEYMKKAGLNSFQANFFGRLIQAGLDETQIRQAVKVASDRFGEKVASELNSGIEKVAFLQQLIRQGVKYAPNLTKAIMGGGGAGRAAAATKAMSNLATGVKNHTGLGTLNPIQGARTALSEIGQAGGLRQAGKVMADRAATGFATGALNPYTGLAAGDSEGNIFSRENLQRSLMSGAAGATLGQLGGKGLQGIQRRMIAGQGVGSGLGLAGDIAEGVTGIDGLGGHTETLGRMGFLGGAAAPSMFRGAPMATGMRAAGRGNLGSLDKLDLNNQLINLGGRAVRGAKNTFMSNPRGSLATAGALAGGAGLLQVPGAINRQGEEMQKLLADQALKLRQDTQGYAQDFYDQAAGMRQDINAKLAPVQQAAQQAQGMLGGFGGLQGIMGQAGQFFGQNKEWLIPLLLGGGGAALGYGLGGGTGAALGGIATPLAYMLMQNPQIVSGMMGGAPQGSVAQQQAAQNQAREDATIQEQLRDPVAAAQAMAMPENEIQRQMAQQQQYAPAQ